MFKVVSGTVTHSVPHLHENEINVNLALFDFVVVCI